MDVIVISQATGQHGWSSFETYVNAAGDIGLKVGVVQPRAEWGADQLAHDDNLCERLLEWPTAVVLLCGVDWHSQPLHSSTRHRDALRRHGAPRIGLFQEHLSAEWIRGDASLASLFDSAALSACEVLTHVACNHEADVAHLRALGVTLPILFLPFCADTSVFRNERPMDQRDRRAFFRGKRLEFMGASPYAARERMARRLQSEPSLAMVAELEPAAQLDRTSMIQAYVGDLNAYRIQLNLPSVSDSLTCRPFEVMACGGALVQTRIDGDLSSRLLPAATYATFSRDDPESLVSRLHELHSSPQHVIEMAAAGEDHVRRWHSGVTRVKQLLDWAHGIRSDNSVYAEMVQQTGNWRPHDAQPKQPLSAALTAQPLAGSPRQPCLVIDLVFYQRADTGIAQVWNHLLRQWHKLGFSSYFTLIIRAESAFQPPQDIIQHYRCVETQSHGSADDSAVLQALCDELGATLFLSTYYTQPLKTPSLLLVHDCIPEKLTVHFRQEADWAEKARAVAAAQAYVCVSASTAADLKHFYKDETRGKPVFLAHNEFSDRFAPVQQSQVEHLREVLHLRDKHLLLVGERMGYRGYKNGEWMAEVLQALARVRPDIAESYTLLCVGGADWGDELTIEPQLERHLARWHVKRSSLSHDSLLAAYTGATLLLYPSLMEGFGLPPGEAALCGTPTFAIDTAINREIYGDALCYASTAEVEAAALQLAEYIDGAADWKRSRTLPLGDQLRRFAEARGGATQAGTMLECAILLAQRGLPLDDPSLKTVLFDAHPASRHEWLDRLIWGHPACMSDEQLAFGDESLASAAVVSIWKGKEYAQGCLSDLTQQTAFAAGSMEVLLIDSASPDGEFEVLATAIRRLPRILYARSVERESLYRAWNRGARYSRARYISNANLDDRHRADFFETLSRDLDREPSVQLIYPAQYLTTIANEHFRDHHPVRSWAWPDYTLEQLRIGNHVGSQPMWRRTLHQKIGWFEERYRIAGDYDFWCRIAHRVGPLKLHPVHIGLYYFNGAGIEHGDPVKSEAEVAEICARYGIQKNYEISADDRNRNMSDGTVQESRKLTDLQYNGVALERDINIIVLTTGDGGIALSVLDSALSQSISKDHRFSALILNPTWSEADAQRFEVDALAPLSCTFKAARTLSPDSFAEPKACTVLLFAAIPSRTLLESHMSQLYASSQQRSPLTAEGRNIGIIGRSVGDVLPEVDS